MPNYATISAGSGRSSPADMSRRRYGGRGGGEASMISSVVNLLNTIVGAGTLAMPAAMSHMGVVLGVAVIIWSGITSAFGLYLQSRCARYLDRGHSSFFALSQITYPNAAVVFDTAIAIKCFGVGVSYLIIIGDLMPGVALGFDSHLATTLPFLVDRNFWITVFILLIIPLAYLRRLDSLKYTSLIALVSIGYLIILVVYHYAVDLHPARGPVRIITWEGPVAMLSSLPVVVFAYTCHQNMFSILNEIEDNSPANVVSVVATSIGSAASIYILVAITGYLTFGNQVIGNIVAMYPPNIASTVGKAAIVVLVTFSVPLQVHPCRASLDAVLKWRPNKASRGQTSPSSSALLLPTVATDSHGAPVAPMSDLRFASLTTFIIVLSYITALSVSSLDRVLAYIGSTGSTSISFILPGLFFYKISDPDSIHHQRLMKEDDDAGIPDSESEEDTEINPDEASLLSGVPRTRNLAQRLSSLNGKKKWRWDLEHLEHGLLRKMALGIAIYGILVMCVCLILNTFFTTAH